jgi:hypothetical protein
MPQKNKRFQHIKKMCERHYFRHFMHNGIRYLSARPDLLPEDRYRQQIMCFWVLLDYLDQVDEHCATGMVFPIHMRIEDREYGIAFVEKESERFYQKETRHGRNMKYILIVEDEAMISRLRGDQIAAFATISDTREVRYYTMEGDDDR